MTNNILKVSYLEILILALVLFLITDLRKLGI